MKFRKFHTIEETICLVPSDFYQKMERKIKGNICGYANTRMYLYYLDRDSVMWRYPITMDWQDAKDTKSIERVLSQWQFNPEVYIV